MGRRETLIHLGAQAGTKAIHALGEPDHTLRDAAYVMTKVLRHDVEMAPGLGGGVSHFLAECLELPAQGPDLAAQGPDLAAQGPDLAANGSELLSQGPDLTAQGPELTANGSELLSQGPELAAQGPELPP